MMDTVYTQKTKKAAPNTIYLRLNIYIQLTIDALKMYYFECFRFCNTRTFYRFEEHKGFS